MKTPICRVTFVVVALLLTGCYTSPVPIAPADEAPRLPGLAGIWLSVPDEPDEAPVRLTLTTTDERIFHAEAMSTNPAEKDVFRFEAHATRLGSDLYASLRILGEEDEGYLIVWFELPDRRSLRARIVDDELMTTEPTTSAGLRAFLLENAGNPALYEDETMYFVRQ